jgi:hypothetical protein
MLSVLSLFVLISRCRCGHLSVCRFVFIFFCVFGYRSCPMICFVGRSVPLLLYSCLSVTPLCFSLSFRCLIGARLPLSVYLPVGRHCITYYLLSIDFDILLMLTSVYRSSPPLLYCRSPLVCLSVSLSIAHPLSLINRFVSSPSGTLWPCYWTQLTGKKRTAEPTTTTSCPPMLVGR